jgi:tetratricopeptide (TPR) repeat protein
MVLAKIVVQNKPARARPRPAPVAARSADLVIPIERPRYRSEDLMAVGEVAYHYLMNGAHQLALTIFEGLTTVAPEDAYYALALGLVFDRMNDREMAARWYERAGRLDPQDGRSDVNRAELLLEAGVHEQALALLERGAEKARRRKDEALERKARAIARHLLGSRGVRRG